MVFTVVEVAVARGKVQTKILAKFIEVGCPTHFAQTYPFYRSRLQGVNVLLAWIVMQHLKKL